LSIQELRKVLNQSVCFQSGYFKTNSAFGIGVAEKANIVTICIRTKSGWKKITLTEQPPLCPEAGKSQTPCSEACANRRNLQNFLYGQQIKIKGDNS
jgi:hypothetical protein